MTRDLIARAAAAQAAADADREPRCEWCGATDAALTVADYYGVRPNGEHYHKRTVTECENASACHARFEILNTPVPPSATPDARETGRTAPHGCGCSTDDHLGPVCLPDDYPEGT